MISNLRPPHLTCRLAVAVDCNIGQACSQSGLTTKRLEFYNKSTLMTFDLHSRGIFKRSSQKRCLLRLTVVLHHCRDSKTTSTMPVSVLHKISDPLLLSFFTRKTVIIEMKAKLYHQPFLWSSFSTAFSPNLALSGTPVSAITQSQLRMLSCNLAVRSHHNE